MPSSTHWMNTSGESDPVWVHHVPYDKYPHFPPLTENMTTDVCIVGAGIAGISIAYELVNRGKKVTMIEARQVLSGETGRTAGHLSTALDDGYAMIEKEHGFNGARIAAESHAWAIERVGQICKSIGIDCDYRRLPGYEISPYPRGHPSYHAHVARLKQEVKLARTLGLPATFHHDLTVQGWNGSLDHGEGAKFADQATFHPTRYCVGVLDWLRKQSNFHCFAHTRMMSMHESEVVEVHTKGGYTITAADMVEATCIPLQRLGVAAEMQSMRTYCIAIRIPKGSIEDCLIGAGPYRYARCTQCDDKEDYLVLGGCDHKVGLENTRGRFAQLETWARERFTNAGTVDYKWSGQVFEPSDCMACIGKDPGQHHTYIITGDSGNGLTHGVLAGKMIADEIEGVDNPWASLYNPDRTIQASSVPRLLQHAVTHYQGWVQPDVKDIEDLAVGSGGVIKEDPLAPVAVYKDEEGNAHRFSAVCPHSRAVLNWNQTEKSWDCPVHGSRFSCDGVCVQGPSKSNLTPINDLAKREQRAQEAI
ncbi:gamma-glutamylputrescine oxidoreductase [Aspergillus sclerotioniger CBS 115572]|uniref:Gamma-glutamylputrescine oxidoreductase n=1 Tax=Aspergillus sclerotioniger CBS 115572 TaxID=1450535 RepID=A0A317V151_9EURO|nr:gamma-glutamylputrescine oxidoreductase [Aspergillus sclerotioniger CBS 115572]PWY67121.1 gamma-glutamylputrescine oxidoreductase [Aspergillus sclerotioniger CBS 115572]